VTGVLTIRSDATDRPVTTLALVGHGNLPPVVRVLPESISMDLVAGDSAQVSFDIGNVGVSDLLYRIDVLDGDSTSARPAGAVLSAAPGRVTTGARPVPVAVGSGRKTGYPAAAQAAALAEYTGDLMSFGVGTWGDVFPFVYPHDTAQLYSSGYTVVYRAEGQDMLVTTYFTSGQIAPRSFSEIQNDSDRVVAEYVANTYDDRIEITRRFIFDRHDSYVRVETRLANLTADTLRDVVFKAVADWDVDVSFGNDVWYYDTLHNMVIAADRRWTGLAGQERVALMDIEGRNDYWRRPTTVDYPVPPSIGFDGWALLHFDLGDLMPFGTTDVTTAFAAADNREELERVADRALRRVPWLATDGRSGRLPADSSAHISTRFSARELIAGEYRARIRIGSNDPATPLVWMHAALSVRGAPRIALESDSVSFGVVYLGYPATYPLTISNQGTDRLQVDDIVADHPAVSVDASTLLIAPYADTTIWITVDPSDTGRIEAQILVKSDDSLQGELIVHVSAEAAHPPRISHVPQALSLSVGAGDSTETTVVIRNDGPGILHWSFPELLGSSGVRGRGDVAPGAVADTIDPSDIIRASPPAGTVAPASAADATLVVAATTLAPGEYRVDLTLAHNDPARPDLSLPLSLYVFEVVRGDANADNTIDVKDIMYVVNSLWKAGPDPFGQAGDVDCDFSVGITDLQYLINYVFRGGPAPGC